MLEYFQILALRILTASDIKPTFLN